MERIPRRGIWTVAFVTGETEGEVAQRLDEEMINIYVPTTPNPTSGFLLMVPRRDLIFLDMPVEDAAKYIISIGVITPETEAKIAKLPSPDDQKDELPSRLSAE